MILDVPARPGLQIMAAFKLINFDWEDIRTSYVGIAPMTNPLARAKAREEAWGRAGFLAFGERQSRFEESAMAQGLTLKTAGENRAAVAARR